MSSFKQIEQLLNLPELKLKKAADTRWLSHDTACRHTLVKVLPALEAYLEQEASERGDMLVVGLSKVVKKYKFIASLYLMCDALPIVSHFSCIFQVTTIDMSDLHKHVTVTLEGLRLLLSTDGEYLSKFDDHLTTSVVLLTSLSGRDYQQHFKS